MHVRQIIHSSSSCACACTLSQEHWYHPPTLIAHCPRALDLSHPYSNGWTRVIVEKPFGRDSASSAELGAGLAKHLKEEQTYRIDHYLGKELIENLVSSGMLLLDHVPCNEGRTPVSAHTHTCIGFPGVRTNWHAFWCVLGKVLMFVRARILKRSSSRTWRMRGIKRRQRPCTWQTWHGIIFCN